MNRSTATTRHLANCLLLSAVLFLGIVQWSFLPVLIQDSLFSGRTAVEASLGHSSQFAAPSKCLIGNFLQPFFEAGKSHGTTNHKQLFLSAKRAILHARRPVFLPSVEAIAGLTDVPKNLIANVVFDQSVFVRKAIENLLDEGAIGLVLTGLMILFFLGSMRATAAVFVSIPLSALAAFLAISAGRETIQSMGFAPMHLRQCGDWRDL